MLFESARLALIAAETEMERRDACDSWESDEEIQASVLRLTEAEDNVAESPAVHASEIAFKLRLAIGFIDEAGAIGTFEKRLRTMLRGALADLDRGGFVALA